MPILLPEQIDRNDIINFLKKKRIQSSIHYPAFWTFKAYKKKFKPSYCPISLNITEKELTLPLYPSMTFDEVELVTNALLEYNA